MKGATSFSSQRKNGLFAFFYDSFILAGAHSLKLGSLE
jgi:hypothetical protein